MIVVQGKKKIGTGYQHCIVFDVFKTCAKLHVLPYPYLWRIGFSFCETHVQMNRTRWRGAGLSQEASVVQEAGNDDVISWESYRKPNRISMNKAKHNQTMATGSTAPDTTPSAPSLKATPSSPTKT